MQSLWTQVAGGVAAISSRSLTAFWLERAVRQRATRSMLLPLLLLLLMMMGVVFVLMGT
jgi:hypothetical protein